MTLPVRLFRSIQDKIDPLVRSISAVLIAMTALVMVARDRASGLDRLFVGSDREA